MRLSSILLISFFLTWTLTAQTVRLSGNVRDAQEGLPLANVIVKAIGWNDSSLVGFSRSNSKGFFEPIVLRPDTYFIVFSLEKYEDNSFLITPQFRDTSMFFKNIAMTRKSININEVVVHAYRESVHYKGDTLSFIADSVKNTEYYSVEDLIKRLPGFQVDLTGKILLNGKQVNKILVEGEEFFASDATAATRNLSAFMIDQLQAFEKRNEDLTGDKNETQLVINLKLKPFAKKGVFGKIGVGNNFDHFYENEFSASRFNDKQRISAFGGLGNTPKYGITWGKPVKGDDSEAWNYDEKLRLWTQNENGSLTNPRAIKSGLNFNDHVGKNTRISADYTTNDNTNFSGEETNTQIFLNDTSFTNRRKKAQASQSQFHALSSTLSNKFDSLSDLNIQTAFRYEAGLTSLTQTEDFFSSLKKLTRSTVIQSQNNNKNYSLNTRFSFRKRFRKIDRLFQLAYQPAYVIQEGHSGQSSEFRYFANDMPDSGYTQTRIQNQTSKEHHLTVAYVEPLTKWMKYQLSYDLTISNNSTTKKTYDGSPDGVEILNYGLSNSFVSNRIISRGGLELTFKLRKLEVSLGADGRNFVQTNIDLVTKSHNSQNINNLMSRASLIWNIGMMSNLTLRYSTFATQPDIRLISPVVDNSDPNRIMLGNSNLRPNFTNNFDLRYSNYNSARNTNLWLGVNANVVEDQFSNITYYDNLGRAVTTATNVNGNYFGNVVAGIGTPLFDSWLKINSSMSMTKTQNISFVNRIKTISDVWQVIPKLGFEANNKVINGRIDGSLEYNSPTNSLNQSAQQPYYTYRLTSSFEIRLPAAFSLIGDGNYVNNGNRAPGYDLNYFIINGSINKDFLKRSNLRLTISANDILNQNITNQRTITPNQIVDKKTNVIKRYFLVVVTYRFIRHKEPETEY